MYKLLIGVVIIVLYISLLLVVAESAKARGRNQFYWVLVGLFLTPFAAFLALLCAGETEKEREWRLKSEEALKFEVRTDLEADLARRTTTANNE